MNTRIKLTSLQPNELYRVIYDGHSEMRTRYLGFGNYRLNDRSFKTIERGARAMRLLRQRVFAEYNVLYPKDLIDEWQKRSTRTNHDAYIAGESDARTRYGYVSQDPEKAAGLFISAILQKYYSAGNAVRVFEIGAGIGDKLYLAQTMLRHLGFVPHISGVEIEADSVALAHKLQPSLLSTLALGDIMDDLMSERARLWVDNMSKADIIYLWMPLRQADCMKKIMRQLTACMKNGAVVIDDFLSYYGYNDNTQQRDASLHLPPLAIVNSGKLVPAV